MPSSLIESVWRGSLWKSNGGKQQESEQFRNRVLDLKAGGQAKHKQWYFLTFADIFDFDGSVCTLTTGSKKSLRESVMMGGGAVVSARIYRLLGSSSNPIIHTGSKRNTHTYTHSHPITIKLPGCTKVLIIHFAFYQGNRGAIKKRSLRRRARGGPL